MKVRVTYRNWSYDVEYFDKKELDPESVDLSLQPYLDAYKAFIDDYHPSYSSIESIFSSSIRSAFVTKSAPIEVAHCVVNACMFFSTTDISG